MSPEGPWQHTGKHRRHWSSWQRLWTSQIHDLLEAAATTLQTMWDHNQTQYRFYTVYDKWLQISSHCSLGVSKHLWSQKRLTVMAGLHFYFLFQMNWLNWIILVCINGRRKCPASQTQPLTPGHPVLYIMSIDACVNTWLFFHCMYGMSVTYLLWL